MMPRSSRGFPRATTKMTPTSSSINDLESTIIFSFPITQRLLHESPRLAIYVGCPPVLPSLVSGLVRKVHVPLCNKFYWSKSEPLYFNSNTAEGDKDLSQRRLDNVVFISHPFNMGILQSSTTGRYKTFCGFTRERTFLIVFIHPLDLISNSIAIDCDVKRVIEVFLFLN